MGSRRMKVALRRRAAIALAVWAFAFTMLAVAAAIPEGPTAMLTVDDPFPAVGQVVHFNASASAAHDEGNGRIVAFRFSFGDGQGTEWQSSPFADHPYAAEGSFEATVTVLDDRGATGSASLVLHSGMPPPPVAQAPDLVPIQVQLAPAAPMENESVNLTVVVLNRGGGTADAATLVVYDLPPNATATLASTEPLPAPLAPSRTASVALGPFVARAAGNHTLRVLVIDVAPQETDLTNNELDVQMVVRAPGLPTNPGGGGASFTLSPFAVGLGGAAVAAVAGAAFLLRRPPAVGPLDPPPAAPPDRSPPPIWPL